jgi:SAM-dependent methyltransferase
MHPEALDAVRRMMVESGYPSADDPDRHRMGIDFGGADVNGTARALFSPAVTWHGLDIAPGPGVDIVADARTWEGMPDLDPREITEAGQVMCSLVHADVILCTELLEHVAPLPDDITADSGWVQVLQTMHRVLKPGGFAFITCASTGRRPHGARGEHDVPIGEHYRNVDPGLFSTAVSAIGGWSAGRMHFNPNPGDLYAWMKKA